MRKGEGTAEEGTRGWEAASEEGRLCSRGPGSRDSQLPRGGHIPASVPLPATSCARWAALRGSCWPGSGRFWRQGRKCLDSHLSFSTAPRQGYKAR